MTPSPWREAMLDWYRRNRRDLPWRRTRDPYAIWVSEVMLQQTQVATVLPYFERWMERFPSVERLAESDDQDVLSLWQGLGYYRRAKLLRKGAQKIVAQGWPNDLAGWLAVPGVGHYTAAAIGSIALDLPAAVVDGNVERVYARFTACSRTGTELLKAARSWADDVLDRRRPGDWNQALMELGATICTPRAPKCEVCPLAQACVARQTWTVERFPVPPAASETIRESHTVWVPFCEGRFGIRQIPEGEWWGGMWEFPRSTHSEPEKELSSLVGEGWREELGQIRHQVTHHRITIEAWLVRAERCSEPLDWHSPNDMASVPMPSPQRKVLARAMRALGLS